MLGRVANPSFATVRRHLWQRCSQSDTNRLEFPDHASRALTAVGAGIDTAPSRVVTDLIKRVFAEAGPWRERLGVSDNQRILLIDGDRMWRYFAAAALRERDFLVTDRASVADLVGMVDEHSPDLVVLDAGLTDPDAFAACDELRACGRFGQIPVLMMVGDDDRVVVRAFDAGATDCQLKTSHWNLLVERIRQLIRAAETQRELLESQVKLAEAQSAGRVGAFELDLDSMVVTGAPGCFSLFGFDPHLTAIPVLLIRKLIDPSCVRAADVAFRRAMRDGAPFSTELALGDGGQQQRVLALKGSPVADADGRITKVIGVIRDVTESRVAQDELRRARSSDTLTGLPNRAQFLSCCADAIAAARSGGWQVAVVVIDIDHFAQINQRFGQSGGDEVLVGLATRMLDLPGFDRHGHLDDSGPRPVLVSRMAADHFALLMPEVHGGAQVDAAAQWILEAMGRPFTLRGERCVVSASIGVAWFPADGDAAGVLLSRADQACAKIKTSRRSGIHWYSPELDDEGRVRMDLTRDLRNAIERGGLELHYQAIVDAQRCAVTGAEALIRWRTPQGVIPPSEFIPLAEETGLIVPMGEWAVGEACRQLGQWQVSGLDIRFVSVNLPSMHFERSSLLDVVRKAIADNDLERGALDLELTETGLIRDIERTIPRLQVLRDAGATISIDDFGTGYSSLAYLTRLPVAKLKIDRSFVRDMGASPRAAAIARAIIALGYSLDLQVVAEGVETEEQAIALQRLGCNLIQGFLFARPVQAAAFPQAMDSAIDIARLVFSERQSAEPPIPIARSRSISLAR